MALINSIWNNRQVLGGAFSVSMESFGADEEIVNPNTNEVVSDTEVEQMATEADEINADVDAIQRTTSAIDAGEGIAEAAGDGAQPATPREAALAQAGVAQTMAAVGAPSEEIVDAAKSAATESAGGYVISMEGFIDKLKAIWQSIVEYVSKIYHKMKQFVNRLWNSTASVLKKVKKIKERLKDIDKVDKDKKIEKWHSFFKQITVGASFNPKESCAKLSDAIKIAETAVKENKIVSDMKKKASDLKTDKEDVQKSQETVVAVLDSFSKDMGADQLIHQRFGREYVGAILELEYGNKALFEAISKDKQLSPVAIINTYTCRIDDLLDSFDPSVKEPKYEILTKDVMSTAADNIEKLIKALEDYYNKGYKSDYDDVDDIKKTINEKISKLSEHADASVKDGLKVFQRTYAVMTQLVRGKIGVCTHFVKTANAMCSLLNLNIDQYDKKDK